jgi:hypothetical protein
VPTLGVAHDHELDAERRYLLEVAPQDHRVGDVRDVELVEADETVPPRGALREPGDRILFPLQRVELAVHLAHEVVKVHPALALQRHA